jgi:hypothetical protein
MPGISLKRATGLGKPSVATNNNHPTQGRIPAQGKLTQESRRNYWTSMGHESATQVLAENQQESKSNWMEEPRDCKTHQSTMSKRN